MDKLGVCTVWLWGSLLSYLSTGTTQAQTLQGKVQWMRRPGNWCQVRIPLPGYSWRGFCVCLYCCSEIEVYLHWAWLALCCLWQPSSFPVLSDQLDCMCLASEGISEGVGPWWNDFLAARIFMTASSGVEKTRDWGRPKICGGRMTSFLSSDMHSAMHSATILSLQALSHLCSPDWPLLGFSAGKRGKEKRIWALFSFRHLKKLFLGTCEILCQISNLFWSSKGMQDYFHLKDG